MFYVSYFIVVVVVFSDTLLLLLLLLVFFFLMIIAIVVVIVEARCSGNILEKCLHHFWYRIFFSCSLFILRCSSKDVNIHKIDLVTLSSISNKGCYVVCFWS